MGEGTLQPKVRLGKAGGGSIAPAIFAFIERGATLRLLHARELRARVLLRFAEDYLDVAIDLLGEEIVIGDTEEADRAHDLIIEGSFHDFLTLISAPLARGLPRPTNATGRAALGSLVYGRIAFTGPIRLARGLLKLISVLPQSQTPRAAKQPLEVEPSALP